MLWGQGEEVTHQRCFDFKTRIQMEAYLPKAHAIAYGHIPGVQFPVILHSCKTKVAKYRTELYWI